MPGVATADEEAMEGHRGALRAGEAKGPVGTASMGHEGHERHPGVPTHDEGRVRGHRENALGGQRGGRERRGGGAQARPRLYLPFPFSFLCLLLCLHLWAWWNVHYDRSGRSGVRGKVI